MQVRNNLQNKLSHRTRKGIWLDASGQTVNSNSWLASAAANLSPVPISLGLIMHKSNANAQFQGRRLFR